MSKPIPAKLMPLQADQKIEHIIHLALIDQL